MHLLMHAIYDISVTNIYLPFPQLFKCKSLSRNIYYTVFISAGKATGRGKNTVAE